MVVLLAAVLCGRSSGDAADSDSEPVESSLPPRAGMSSSGDVGEGGASGGASNLSFFDEPDVALFFNSVIHSSR